MKAEEITSAMSRNGWRVTDQRKTLAALFADTDGYLAPKEVYEHLENRYPGVSFDTIYRNLRSMEEIGLLEQFDFGDGVRFRAHCNEHHHHHHVICLSCEKTYPVTHCPMEQLAGIPDSFQVLRHRFEVYGYCGDCQAKGVTEDD